MNKATAGGDPKEQNDLKLPIPMTAEAATQLREALSALRDELQRRLIKRAADREPPRITNGDVLAERSAMLASPGKRASLRVPIARTVGRYVGLAAAGVFFGILGDDLLVLPSWAALPALFVAGIALAVEIGASIAAWVSARD